LVFTFSPFFIFYSLGYRYNFDKHIIEKNGAFFIKSFPKSAQIFINTEKTRQKTPSQITNVKSGQYLVEIKKDGYHIWHKNLPINSGQTTFIEEVALFLTDNQKTNLGQGSNAFIVNQNKDKYAYLINNDLWLTNTELEKTFKIFTFDTPIELIDWSIDDQKILIKQGAYKLFDLQQQKISSLNISAPDKIIWDNQDANVIWFLDDSELYRHNIVLNSTTLKADDLIDFTLSGDYFILQNNQDLSATVTQVDKNLSQEIRELNNLNLGKLTIILADEDYLIFMLGAKLYVQRPFSDLITVPASFAKIYGKFLLINDGYQTMLYDYNDNNTNIIDRSSQIVSDIHWHPNGSYFINEIDGITTIHELDGRDYRNNVKVLEDPLKKLYLFNKKGDKLFIMTETENFYLELQ
jgi:hypothetical protein